MHTIEQRLHTFFRIMQVTSFMNAYMDSLHRISGLFGGNFNLAVWRIFIRLPNLNHAVLTCTHKMN